MLFRSGVIGSYLGRVYTQVQGRPLYSLALAARGQQPGVRTLSRSSAFALAEGGRDDEARRASGAS